MSLMPPVLSAVDPLEESEGSIDPFSTSAAYERLAERILPFVTFRMSRPRFLTTMSVGARVCDEFGDRICTDGISSPSLVFEWYVVEAHVRQRDRLSGDDLHRFPGTSKVQRSLGDGREVGAAAYLKTPRVFGFNGVYKRLAKGIEILTDDLALDEGGWELLRIWEEERGLSGFASGSNGAGRDLREDLARAVATGLSKGYTSPPRSWAGWESIARHLRLAGAGPREKRWLFERLSRTDLGRDPRDSSAPEMRREVIDHLLEHGPVTELADECTFFRGLMQADISPQLRERLDAIDAYEGLCRSMEDAFRLALHLSSRARSAPIGAKEYAAHELGQKLPRQIATASRRAAETRELIEAEPEVRTLADRYADTRSPEELFERVLSHHEDAQRDKPPDGKRPWFERFRGDRVMVRPQYLEPDPPLGTDRYVHPYRITSMTSFLRDLGRWTT